jgi:hypothetical protein
MYALPGGYRAQVVTLHEILQWVAEHKPGRRSLEHWTEEHFGIGTNSSGLTIHFLLGVGLLSTTSDVMELTPAARAWLASGDAWYLVALLHSRVQFIGELISSVAEAREQMEVLGIANRDYSMRWQTLAQVRVRRGWLESIGVIRGDVDGRMVATELGLGIMHRLQLEPAFPRGSYEPPAEVKYRPRSRRDFDRLYRAAYPTVLRRLVEMLDDPRHAEDVALEVFKRAFRLWPKWNGHPPADAWILGITRNMAATHLRRRGPVQAREEVQFEEMPPPPPSAPGRRRGRGSRRQREPRPPTPSASPTTPPAPLAGPAWSAPAAEDAEPSGIDWAEPAAERADVNEPTEGELPQPATQAPAAGPAAPSWDVPTAPAEPAAPAASSWEAPAAPASPSWGIPAAPAAPPWDVPGARPASVAESRIPESMPTHFVQFEPTPPRYIDLTMFDQKDGIRGQRRESSDWLRADEWYELEVAVRMTPTGFTAAADLRPIIDPHKKATLLVVLQPEVDDDLSVREPAQNLQLPAEGDSQDNATFQIRPNRGIAEGASIKCQLRVYYKLNLIEEGLIHIHVVSRFDPVRTSERAIRYEPQRLLQSYTDLEGTQARQLAIDITRDTQGYRLLFTLADVKLVARATINADDLDDMLVGLRNKLREVATSDSFRAQLIGSKWDFQQDLRALAELGGRLWTRMFTENPTTAIAAVGQYLQSNPIADGGLIKITVDPSAAEFIFPWNLLYDRKVPPSPQPVDASGFWGLRYRLEQHVPRTLIRSDRILGTSTPVTLDFVLNTGFDNSGLQTKLIDEFASRSAGALQVSTPPFDEAEKYKNRLAEDAAEILYFYCHGVTRRRRSSTYADLKLAATSTGSPDDDRSWIEPTYQKLYLDELNALEPRLTSQPVVILNLCESAEIYPALTDSFIQFFLSHGASTVIGTECEMTTAFAHPFSEQLLGGFFAGRNVGQVLLDARRHFIDLGNPLGLAYTLYGSATTRLATPVVPDPSRTVE